MSELFILTVGTLLLCLAALMADLTSNNDKPVNRGRRLQTANRRIAAKRA